MNHTLVLSPPSHRTSLLLLLCNTKCLLYCSSGSRIARSKRRTTKRNDRKHETYLRILVHSDSPSIVRPAFLRTTSRLVTANMPTRFLLLLSCASLLPRFLSPPVHSLSQIKAKEGEAMDQADQACVKSGKTKTFADTNQGVKYFILESVVSLSPVGDHLFVRRATAKKEIRCSCWNFLTTCKCSFSPLSLF